MLNTECQIENVVDCKWTKAAIAKAQESINTALNVYLQPIGLLSFKDNNVVSFHSFQFLSTYYINN